MPLVLIEYFGLLLSVYNEILFDFEYSVFQVNPWDQDQIGIKLGTEHVIPKVSKFYVEKGYSC